MIRDWWSLIHREFRGYDRSTFRKDLFSAMTVAAVALPLALAFGVASGASAAAGLVTAVLAGVVIGTLGGAPYQISGPTGAMSAVLIAVTATHGLAGVWIAGVMSGVILILVGYFRLGRLVALIPSPVIAGFTSGIALIIALGQVGNALGAPPSPPGPAFDTIRHYLRPGVIVDPAAIALTTLVVGVMLIWPRIRRWQQVPGSLVAIVLATLFSLTAQWDVPTIGGIPRSILLDERLRLAQISVQDLGTLVVPAMTIAALGAIESLLCGAVAGNMTGIRMHNSLELVAQGVGNIIIPFFGGVPATAAIARTSVNIKSGGATRLVPVLHGLVLLAVAWVLAPSIEHVPLASLAGVLMVTAWRMNEWHAIRFFFGRRLKHAIMAFLVTLAATVVLDLTQAILIGFGISTLIFMAQISALDVTRMPIDVQRLKNRDPATSEEFSRSAVYYLTGPLFFAAARQLLEAVEANDAPDRSLILSMRGVPLIDATGVEVLREIWQRQADGGGTVMVTGLQARAERMIRRSGLIDRIGEDHLFWSADQAIQSLGGRLSPPSPQPDPGPSDFVDATLAVTPHEHRTAD